MSALFLRALLTVGLLCSAAASPAREAKPKFGPEATLIFQAVDYLRSRPAPDCWRLSAFYVPQQTSSACALASVAMLANAVRGLPAGADEPLITQQALLEAAGDARWAEQEAEGGSGVTFADLEDFVRRALAVAGVADYQLDVFKPANRSLESLARLRAALTANEASDRDIMLVYFNQGVLTGDWDGPHISPIGAYDEAERRVLILDVDREWYVPYWSSDEKLLEAMLRPAPARHGALAGETGGFVWVRSAHGPEVSSGSAKP